MFKIPEWDCDTPQDTITELLKKSNKKSKKSMKNKSITSVNGHIDSKKLKVANAEKDNHKTNKIIKKKQNEIHGDGSLLKITNNVSYGKTVISPVTSTTDGEVTKTHKNKKHKNNLCKPKVLPSRKRKHDSINAKTLETDKSMDLQDYSSDKLDKVLINSAKKQFDEKLRTEDKEELLFSDVIDEEGEEEQKPKKVKDDEESDTVLDQVNQPQKSNGTNRFKKKLKHLLDQKESENRNTIKVTTNKLRERMLEKLRAAQFRYLNEKLYTSSGTESQKLFQADPTAFQVYHEGYQQQVKKWPVKPLDVIVAKIKKMPKSHVIADMGCGEATLSQRVPHTVHSFDLVATAPGVVACDMAHTPLRAATVDAVVYCLALMGTDLTKYLLEANRVMKSGGQLLIAEVESRFDNIDNFVKDVERLGFKLKKLDKSNTVFYFMEFTKIRDPPVKKNKLPSLTLKPCLYKKR